MQGWAVLLPFVRLRFGSSHVRGCKEVWLCVAFPPEGRNCTGLESDALLCQDVALSNATSFFFYVQASGTFVATPRW